jgi:branched-chain amino acid transport system permease protein
MNGWKQRPNTLIIIGVAVIVCAIAPAVSATWLDMAVLTGILSLVALSAGLCYGQAGILSMAQAAFAAVGAYATAICTTKFGLPAWAGLLPALLLPAALAWPIARAVTRLPPLATALATLALATLLEIVARNWDSVTGGYVGIAGIPPIPGLEKAGAFNVLVWAFLCFAVLIYENLMHSAYGRALKVVRHDRTRAIADGVAVAPLLSAMLALSAAMAGAGGWLYAHYITYMSPGSLDTNASISALLMAVVGGAGHILGPVLGTLLLNLMTKLLPAQEAQGLFYGGTLILILLVARDGLLGLGESWFGRDRSASKDSVVASDIEPAPAVPNASAVEPETVR